MKGLAGLLVQLDNESFQDYTAFWKWEVSRVVVLQVYCLVPAGQWYIHISISLSILSFPMKNLNLTSIC